MIPGALTGIGRTTAFALAKEGYHVVYPGAHLPRAKPSLRTKYMGTPAEFIRTDVHFDNKIET